MTTFVFGYGSLVRRPDGIPCHLLGHRRAWNVAMDNRRTIPGYKYYVDPETGERPPVRVTFLSLYPAARAGSTASPCPSARRSSTSSTGASATTTASTSPG